MTEAHWLASDTLDRLLSIPDARKSARKLRLVLCACVRSDAVWPLLSSRSSRRVVEASEGFADGGTCKRDLGIAQKSASNAALRVTMASWPASNLTEQVGYADSTLRAYGVFSFVGEAWRFAIPGGLVADVFGNPYRPASTPEAVCLTPQVAAVAQAAYDERSFPSGHIDPVRLAVLADALEDAGCADADILAHCRGAGPHVRGCWVVDLVLGKS
jgi:hypothetical protein